FLTADYSLGVHEFLLTGAVGSAKTTLLAHIAVRHCLEYSGAVCLIGRKVLKDLRETLYLKIKQHLENDRHLANGVHYRCVDGTCSLSSANRSRIIGYSWHDQNFEKFRSIDLSLAIIEELTENDDTYRQAYTEIKMRLGR